jgi:hypothetical protein
VGEALESFFLDGEAGRLEALLNTGSPQAQYCALVCHPHPLYGGTMHNKVVFHTMKELNARGFPVLRFNFRGVGASAGEHDEGRGEVNDVQRALDYLSQRFERPIFFAGFSFGAAIGLRAAVPDPRVETLIALGLPMNAEGRQYSHRALVESAKPKLMLSGERDQFATPGQLRAIYAAAAGPKRLAIIPEADHFFTGRLPEMRAALSEWLSEILGQQTIPAV